jgi:hypothetical protein
MCANVLSVLEGLTHRAELTAAVVQSIGGALTARYQDKFAEEVLIVIGLRILKMHFLCRDLQVNSAI